MDIPATLTFWNNVDGGEAEVDSGQCPPLNYDPERVPGVDRRVLYQLHILLYPFSKRFYDAVPLECVDLVPQI